MADTKDLQTNVRKVTPPQVFLDEAFLYKDGSLWWKTRPADHFRTEGGHKKFNTRFAGKEAGRVDQDGRRVVNVCGKEHYAHRLVWAMFRGDPPAIIDHADGNPLNNTLCNLREATHAQNMANSKKRQRKLGDQLGLPRGVFKVPSGKFRAFLCHQSKTVTLGCFDTVEFAVAARNAAALHAHKSFARLS